MIARNFFQKSLLVFLVAGMFFSGALSQEPAERDESLPETKSVSQQKDFAIPVEIIQSDIEARAENEQLKIQKMMRKSAVWDTRLLFVQTILLTLGTGALILTLRQTHQATTAAIAATEASILIARKQSQAQFLISVGNGHLVWTGEDFQIEASVKVENTGNGAAIGVLGYMAAEAVRTFPTVEAGETLRWAYVPAGQREIPPWTFESSILRPSETSEETFPFFQRPPRGFDDHERENGFGNGVRFLIHVFLEWTDTYDKPCSICIVLESFDDATTWREIERSEISSDQFVSRVSYPYL